uniref:Uncharacterized protein n=1 Tax=Oryza brachyantha TaxID=4533 RepID=J3KZX5_ORYBR
MAWHVIVGGVAKLSCHATDIGVPDTSSPQEDKIQSWSQSTDLKTMPNRSSNLMCQVATIAARMMSVVAMLLSTTSSAVRGSAVEGARHGEDTGWCGGGIGRQHVEEQIKMAVAGYHRWVICKVFVGDRKHAEKIILSRLSKRIESARVSDQSTKIRNRGENMPVTGPGATEELDQVAHFLVRLEVERAAASVLSRALSQFTQGFLYTSR